MEYVRTPKEIWNKLTQEYNFTVDACASDQSIPKFVDKAFQHNCICVFLLPASTNAVYFHKYFWNTEECKPKENIKIEFLARGDAKTSYIFRTDEGIAPKRGYLRPLMLVHKLK